MVADGGEADEILGLPCRRFRRNHAEHGLYRHRHLHHQLAVLLVGFSVGRRMARDLAPGARVIAAAEQIVAIGYGRKGAIERDYFQVVFRQFKIADDLGAKQADDVGADRISEAGKNFFSDGRAAD